MVAMGAEADDGVRDKIIAAFRKHDTEGKGTISRDRLLNVLRAVRRLEPVLLEMELEFLATEVEKGFEQVVDYSAFVDFVWGRGAKKAAEEQPEKKKKKKRAKKAVELTENGIPVLEEAWLRGIFQQCDTSGDQLISKRELIKVSKRSAEVRTFFGIKGGGMMQDGEKRKDEDIQLALDSLFQKIDGDHDRQISWPELMAFYLGRISDGNSKKASEPVALPDGDVSPPSNAPRSLPMEISAPEEAALRSIFDGAGGGDGKAVRKQDAIKAVKHLVDVTAFFKLNQQIRQQALESVTEDVMASIFAGIDGDDEGFMTWLDLESVYVPADSAGGAAAKQELTTGEKKQLEQVFKECDADSTNRIRKKTFKELCSKSMHVSAFMAVRQQIREKALEEATREAMTDLFAGFGGLEGSDDAVISWPEFCDHYKSASNSAT